MRYGFYLPTRGQTASPEALETLVQRGEGLGFASVMIADHLVFPVTIKSRYPYTVSGDFPGQGDVLDQLSLMAFVAAKTTRLRLVTSVMIVPYRNPVLTAKALATIDVLSKGRVTLGVGVGWMREEFEALGAPEFDRRGAVTDEYISIFKTLWTQSPASFSGRFYRFDALHSRPQPVQKPHPPIWVGGDSPGAVRRVATLGDGWHATSKTPAQFAEALGRLRKAADEGRRPLDSIDLSLRFGLTDDLIKQGVAAIVDTLAEYKKLGLKHVVLEFRRDDLGRMLEILDLVTRDVRPAVDRA